MRKALLVILTVFLLFSTIGFADRTDADNETHSWNPVVDRVVGGYLLEKNFDYEPSHTTVKESVHGNGSSEEADKPRNSDYSNGTIKNHWNVMIFSFPTGRGNKHI